jgi:hypothetical protein
MPALSRNCHDCGQAISYWEVHCRCGQFIGCPNYRAATAEREVLRTRYDAARVECETRMVEVVREIRTGG